MKITKRVVDAAGAKGKRYVVWDGESKDSALLSSPPASRATSSTTGQQKVAAGAWCSGITAL